MTTQQVQVAHRRFSAEERLDAKYNIPEYKKKLRALRIRFKMDERDNRRVDVNLRHGEKIRELHNEYNIPEYMAEVRSLYGDRNLTEYSPKLEDLYTKSFSIWNVFNWRTLYRRRKHRALDNKYNFEEYKDKRELLNAEMDAQRGEVDAEYNISDYEDEEDGLDYEFKIFDYEDERSELMSLFDVEM